MDDVPRFLPPREVERLTSLSARHLARMAEAGQFPKPIRLGQGKNGRLGFVEAEVLAWNAARIAERDGTKPMNGVAPEASPAATSSAAKARLPLAELGLPARACNALVADGLIYVGDLVQRSEVDVLGIPNIGRGSLAEIKVALGRHKLKLATPKAAADGD